jgi:hypothetical protein
MALSARSRLCLLTSLTLVWSCSSGAGTTGGHGGSTASSGAGASASHAASSGSGGGGGATSTGAGTGGGINPGCASGIICGDGACCAVGDECVSTACLPGCATHVRCGADNGLCCGADELCLGDTCVAAMGACLDYSDCADGEFCEPTLGKCVPEPMGNICEYKPPTAALTPTIEWSWTGSAIQPLAVQVINMPVVVDLDKDGTPDVIIVTSADYTATHAGYLRALNGKGGAEKWTDPALDVYNPMYAVNPRGTPAAGDLDGLGDVEIVTTRASGGLIAFNHDGSRRWTSTQKDGVTPYTTGFASGTVAMADLDGDGQVYVVVGGVVFDAGGKLIADNGAFAGSHDTSYGAVSIIADVDGNGHQEIVTGHAAYDQRGTHLLWDNGQTDGYPAIADLDGDGKPEIVVVSAGHVRVEDAATGAVLATAPFPAGVGGAGGPPTIADFNGDGKPDFSTAGGNGYMVFTYDGAAVPKTISLLWSSVTQDLSSNRTGSSVFDFQGDGAAEVVYGDECFFRIYSGKDGAVLFQTPSSSATIHEYPVVVDVDADNQTEVLVVSNDYTSPSCPLYGPNDKPRHGLFVYGDANDNWVRTRRIWNQHAYHVTNVGADGSVPNPESPSWINPPGLNNYRQSSQGAGVFNAPDLQASLSADLGGCPTKLHLEALVQNHGSLGVAAGVAVTFYAGAAPGTLILATATTKALLPGQYEVVSADYMVPSSAAAASFYVVVDGDAGGLGAVNECLEDNNQATVDGVSCPQIH